MSEFGQLHFLRPGWLLALPLVWLLTWRLLRRVDSAAAWRGLVAPHLLRHLLVGARAGRRAMAPVWLLGSLWTLGFIALSGPAWQREPAPFAEDRAALVMVLKATPSMLARDIQPSRLQRAVHKIGDLLERRSGALTGLVAYSGSAHRVMPLTRDGRIVSQFAAELTPEVMPRDGDEPLAALELALDELERAAVPGSVLLIVDSLPVGLTGPGIERARRLGVSLHVLVVAAGTEVVPAPGGPSVPALDRDASRAAARALGASWTEVSVGDDDIEALSRAFERRLAQAAGEDTQWRDAGYLLLAPIALLALAWFRRGWRVGAG